MLIHFRAVSGGHSMAEQQRHEGTASDEAILSRAYSFANEAALAIELQGQRIRSGNIGTLWIDWWFLIVALRRGGAQACACARRFVPEVFPRRSGASRGAGRVCQVA
ncbi:MAG: hypothetical protein KKA90_02420 [Nanoarchaeota archaeon]|nr:hypothetical protein [Nanoarchaeota archaeon]